MTAQHIIIATRIPSGPAFDGAARSAESSSAVVFRDGVNRILTGEEPGAAAVVVAAEVWRRSDGAELVAAQVRAGRVAWVEVTAASQVEPAVAAGAHGLIVCGLEGAGLVGDSSSLVLLRLVLPLAGELPVLVRGGIGPDTAAGVVAAGASGVVLDTQLWMASDMPVAPAITSLLTSFNPLDTVTFGPGLGFRYRTFGQVATRPVRELRKLEGAQMTGEGLYAEVQSRLAPEPALADPKRELLPLGQDAGLAVTFANLFGDVASMVHGVRAGVTKRLAAAEADYPFAKGKGICRTNKTRLPFHQGPMAQVADVPEFARAIAQSGSMAWLALANMPTSVATELVDDTAALLGDLPWGAGIIGLDANRYRDEHFAMLKEKKPPFVLVAAGTVEQAMDFERSDVATWLHTPTPGLLRMALESGLTRFILEGTEAGGHVGPLGSLALWQYGVLELERAIQSGIDPATLAMVPAGGLGDAASSRAAAAILMGLHGQGVAVGLQMGTSYLMTSEAVDTGAVSATYQAVIGEAGETLLMGESVSAPTRVLPTAHAHVTFATELDRRAQGVALKERKVAYEHDNLGGLRAAAKSQKIERIDAEQGAIFATISETEQRDSGLFHAGQTAAILGEITDLATYHQRLLDAWSEPLAAPKRVPQASAPMAAETEPLPSKGARPDDIVIVGMGAVLPDAKNKEAFWDNLLAGHCSIREVRPEDRWDPALHWSADRTATDRSYAKIGAFVDDFVPDRKAFRIPPKVLKSIDRVQLFALEAARQALEDAGGFDDSFPRETCAVMIGASQGGDLRLETTFRTEFPVVEKVLEDTLEDEGVDAETAKKIRDRFQETYLAGKTPITEDSMAGELPNCIAGRVAGTFDLGGANWSVDAACASSLAALNVAVQSLRAGAHDAVVVGGVDSCMSPEPYVKFSKIGALSDSWSRPFDASANGFVMGEGGGMLVVMRRADAEAQGRKIYAVVRGVGASSDGRGKGITAPNPKGQRRAVRRAYEDAGVDPKSITYFEAHGTGTPVGDPVEVTSLIEVVGRTTHGASLGSVKSNIGHLKAAAGAAALVKTAMALHHKTLPPTLGVTNPNPKLPLDEGNIRLQLQRGDWDVPEGVPRRAGVSAFGFGGTNVHIVLEEEGAWTSPGSEIDSMDAKTPNATAPVAMAAAPGAPEPTPAPAPAAPEPAAPRGSVSQEDAYATVVQILCERTGYESDEIEPEFELEADLGIDTVKQAEIMAEVREVYALEKDADFRLASYPTLQDLARYVVERSALQGGAAPSAPGDIAAAPAPAGPEPAAHAAPEPAAPEPAAPRGFVSQEDAYATVVQILCERTGYESDEIEPEFELEADLGIDTVKQAEIMAEVREVYALEKDADFRLASYPTLQDLARYVVERSALQGGAAPSAPGDIAAAPAPAPAPVASTPEPTSSPAPSPAVSATAGGDAAWDRLDGLMALGASTTPELRATLDALIRALEGQGMAALEPHLATPRVVAHAVRLAVAYEPGDGPEPVLAILKKTSAALEKGKGMKILANKGVYFSEDAPTGSGGLAFLFPGQGTQYLGMGRDLMERFPEAAEVFSEADRVMQGDIERPLSSFMHPGALADEDAKKLAFKELTRTEITQPAVLTMDAAVLAILRSLGYRADMVVGHSLGEYGACIAAGVMPFEGALKTVAARGAAMASVRPMNDDNGWMLAVSASAEKVEAELEGLDGYIVCANKNCHAQTVTGGETETSKRALEKLTAAGFDAQRIPVSHAFHTKIIAPATEALLVQLATIEIHEPQIPILSNVTARPYPTDPDEIRDLLARQVASPVEYIDQIEAMYAAGIRTFVEVGPKKAQVGFVANILEGRDHRAIPTNHPKFGGLPSLRMAVGQLLAAGQAVEAYQGKAPGAHQAPRSAAPQAQSHGEAVDTAWKVKSDVVCTGTAIGLPGLADAFDERGFETLLTGRSLIESMPQEHREAMASKKITRLMKGADGTAEFVSIDSVDEVLKLSGQIGDFDLTRDYGVEERVVAGLDRASQLAFAAGLEALRDAHIPLVPRYRTTRSGKKVTIGSALPESMRDETGVIFASAFTGYDVAIDEATRAATDPNYSFDGRYVLKLIGMGHARFAEQIGARGPNTRINAACASTTQAISIGEDWIRLGRCNRVIIIGGDDVTDDTLMPWVGGGFLATGAATQEAEVTQAALPFDKRRNGTILGAGAVALILESPEVAQRRGVVPLADLVGTRMANSAFHATRLDVDHIAGEVQALVGRVEERFETPRSDISGTGVFVSHETFTPARGGSAAAEVESLRSAFGDGMDDIVIANIKGYTGHPMGAGLEDALAVRMLHKRRVPPIPHLEQTDESLGNLTFSDGSETDLDYAIRLAAGFGSQLALGVWRRRAQSENRLDQATFDRWLKNDVGLENPEVWVEKRVLKARTQGVNVKAQPTVAAPAPVAPAPAAPVAPTPPVPEAPPVAPALAAAPSGGVPTSEEAYARIVTVLCERTGYDADEVEPQFELEADLGIDTVKQAEIMAEVREVYALEKDADFRLASYPTIQDLARYVIERASLGASSAPNQVQGLGSVVQTAPEPASAQAPVPTDEATTVSLDSAYAAIVKILCERTGYDAEEVEPQFELEADLGIDTVKQAEIMAEVREVYALEKDADFRLADYPTIQDLARYVIERTEAQSPTSASGSSTPQTVEEAPAAIPEPSQVVAAAPEAPEALEAVSRPAPAAPSQVPFLARPVVIRQIGAAQADVSAAGTRVQGKSVVILGGTDERIEPLESALERLGARVVHLVPGEEDLLMDEGALTRKLTGVKNLVGMFNLLGTESLPPLEKPADFALHQARRTFHVARAWVNVLGDAPRADHFFVSLTNLGGALGHGDSGTIDGPQSLVGGSVAGLTKTLSHEWADATVRVVDLPEQLSATDPLVILGESISRRGHREIGLRDGLVHVAETADVEHTPMDHSLGVDTRWLITGGGRGITAVVALDLATRFPGGTFVLTGRTALTHPDPTRIDLDAERARIKATMKEAGDKVTPVTTGRALKPFEAQKEIAETLAALQGAGAQSRYVAFDVSDAASTRKALGEIGHVDVVVHGAGLEDSHFLMDKDTAVFDRVFITKVSGLIHLLDALTVNPRAVVAFTSVAGRYGNAGQVDYAAANDALSRMLAARSRAGDFQGIATDWGPWADVGMATRGSIQTVLEASGVAMMPPEFGAPMVGELLASGHTGEVVCSGALGALAATPATGDTEAPFFQELVRDYDGVIGTLPLDAANMAMLDDHRIEGTAVLPGVMGMELFAQATRALDPSTRVVGYEDVVFERPVKAHDGKEVSVQVTARPAGAGRVRVVLESLRRLATGKESRTQHFTATVLTGTLQGPPQPFVLPTEDLVSEGPDAETIYEVFFHERSYRVLDRVPFMGPRGLVAIGQTSEADPAPGVRAAQLTSDPLAREAALQAAGLWSMSQDGRMRLPAAIGRVSLFGTAAPGEELVIRVSPRSCDVEHHARYDAEVWTREGRLLQRLESLDMIDAGPLPEGTGIVPGSPRRVLRDFMDISDAELALDRLGMPLERLVTMEDLAAFHRQKNVQRRGEWLSARLAAKRLAGDWLQARFGVRPPPDAMLVVKDEFGAPSLLLRDGWADRLTDGEMMNLSISHSDGVAVAAIPVDPEIRVGIDIERIAPRPDAFADTWLESSEMALPILDATGGQANEDARITALWCLKEATTKALGLGFNLAVSEVVVKTIDEHGVADVGVYGQAADRLVHLGGAEVSAEVRVDPRFAIAESIVVVDGGPVHDDDDAALAAVAALLREKGFLIEGRVTEGENTSDRSVN